jgi:hypothetical protein
MSAHTQWFLNFLDGLFKEKNKYKFLLASLKYCCENRILFQFFFNPFERYSSVLLCYWSIFSSVSLLLVDFLQCTAGSIAGFQNNFQDHRRILRFKSRYKVFE